MQNGTEMTVPPALRAKFRLCAFAALALDVVYGGVFLLWPYFGARLGSGVHRWERTLGLVGYGLWLSVVAVVFSIAAKPGKARKLLVVLSIIAAGFWFFMQLPVNDFLAVERVRQFAAQPH